MGGGELLSAPDPKPYSVPVEEKTIYTIGLHESLRIDTDYVHRGMLMTTHYRVMRVPGGWLYGEESPGSPLTFVPLPDKIEDRSLK